MSSLPFDRNIAVDGFRGLLLVIIAINHLEGSLLTPFTREPFGFVSAAEGFVFLSGFVAALIYGGLSQQPISQRRKIWARVAVIYGYSLVGVFTIAALLHLHWLPSVWYIDWGNYFLLESYLKYPFESLLLSVLQLHQMGYFDILIAYMLPMLALPFALRALAAGRWWLVAILSLTVWGIAQLSSDQWLAPFYSVVAPNIPVHAGYLDVFAWQLYFYCGVLIGFWRLQGVVEWPRMHTIFIISIFAVLAFGLLDYYNILTERTDTMPAWIMAQLSWQDAGFFRVLNTLAWAGVVSWFIQHRCRMFTFKPLVFLGQHSLPVFVYHSIAVYFFLPWMMAMTEPYRWYWDFIISVLFVFTLLIPAYLHWCYRQSRQ